MATTSYTDVGAVQRPYSGAPTAKTSYVDVGAVQNQEFVAPPPGAKIIFRNENYV